MNSMLLHTLDQHITDKDGDGTEDLHFQPSELMQTMGKIFKDAGMKMLVIVASIMTFLLLPSNTPTLG